jgi:hypothetical protein
MDERSMEALFLQMQSHSDEDVWTRVRMRTTTGTYYIRLVSTLRYERMDPPIFDIQVMLLQYLVG